MPNFDVAKKKAAGWKPAAIKSVIIFVSSKDFKQLKKQVDDIKVDIKSAVYRIIQC